MLYVSNVLQNINFFVFSKIKVLEQYRGEKITFISIHSNKQTNQQVKEINQLMFLNIHRVKN